jgi:hypothetical protein
MPPSPKRDSPKLMPNEANSPLITTSIKCDVTPGFEVARRDRYAPTSRSHTLTLTSPRPKPRAQVDRRQLDIRPDMCSLHEQREWPGPSRITGRRRVRGRQILNPLGLRTPCLVVLWWNYQLSDCQGTGRVARDVAVVIVETVAPALE